MRKLSVASGVRKDLKKISPEVRKRIFAKIHYFLSLDDPRSTAVPMVDMYAGSWRWRIGDWRVIFDIDEHGEIVIILIIRHRSKIYN